MRRPTHPNDAKNTAVVAVCTTASAADVTTPTARVPADDASRSLAPTRASAYVPTAAAAASTCHTDTGWPPASAVSTHRVCHEAAAPPRSGVGGTRTASHSGRQTNATTNPPAPMPAVSPCQLWQQATPTMGTWMPVQPRLEAAGHDSWQLHGVAPARHHPPVGTEQWPRACQHGPMR